MIKRFGEILCLMIFIAGFPLPWGYADEILFTNQGPQIGTIVHENEQTVTIRFAKDSIQSIVKNQKEDLRSSEQTEHQEPSAKTQMATQEQMKRLEKRIERLEKNGIEDKKALNSSNIDPSETMSTAEQLLQEEMGSVTGVISWHNKPLVNREVRIRLERYTGSAWGALNKMFGGNGSRSAQKKEITLKTQTDSLGGYIFENVPPGQYRLSWMPDAETGWIRRLREKPDFEVIPGELTIQNIPEKKK